MGPLVKLVFYMYSADGANYQCFICKCTEKQLKKVPFGTLSTLTICYSLFCQSATPEVLALSGLIVYHKVCPENQSRPIFPTDGSDFSIGRL